MGELTPYLLFSLLVHEQTFFDVENSYSKIFTFSKFSRLLEKIRKVVSDITLHSTLGGGRQDSKSVLFTLRLFYKQRFF